MPRPIPGSDGFVDDVDSSQPRVTITIDGGLPLPDVERTIRDEMVKPFLDDFILAVRNFYVGREMLGPKRRIDAKLAAAIEQKEVSTQ